ncbi:MAG: succinate dehydrogenase, cytochrome b556 subunit [Gluconacetobacter diazotrophicus]|nr:succinate dehydrogenase, cytochrome b556 subunit [Gluconacetobacter diazotrophicus]
MTDVRDALFVAPRSDGTLVRRPMSPHLQVYRFQLHMALSITNRMTGVAASVGTLLLVWWLVAAASGPKPFDTVQAVIGSWIGLVVLFGWTLALVFHTVSGVRHLFWDAGYGFDKAQYQRMGPVVVAVTALLTILIWAIGLSLWSGTSARAGQAAPVGAPAAPASNPSAGN